MPPKVKGFQIMQSWGDEIEGFTNPDFSGLEQKISELTATMKKFQTSLTFTLPASTDRESAVWD